MKQKINDNNIIIYENKWVKIRYFVMSLTWVLGFNEKESILINLIFINQYLVNYIIDNK